MVKFDELFGEPAEGFKPDKKKRVGGYILGKTLGEGSFAKVRIATHVLTNEKVAVKVINKKLIVKREYVRKNMRREAVMLQRIEHPHIVKLYEVMETENSFYMVTELAEGGDFMKYLTVKQCLSEAETRRYMRQIVSAVDHMHRSGVCHRDLKIENLLLDRDMNIKIIDFGLSNHWDGQSLLSTQCGSPAYAAPEIFSKKQYGPSVDVWSIGINMFAMLTGRLPFLVDPPTNLTKLHALILKGCSVPDELSSSCRDLVQRLLNPTVGQRIRMRELITHPWINEDYIPIQAWGLKVKMLPEDINQTAVDFMVYYLHMREEDITDAVLNCKPNSMTGTYYLLCERNNKGIPLPDENVMAQGQRKDVVDEMKRHHVSASHNKQPPQQNGVHDKSESSHHHHSHSSHAGRALLQDAGQTPRFPAISHRDSSRPRHSSSRVSNAPLSAKKRSQSHEVLSSLQQGLNVVRLDPDSKEKNMLILQDLDHIIKDLGGDTDSSAAPTPRGGADSLAESGKVMLSGASGRKSRGRPPNRGILKREKATSLPESLNTVVEHRTLFHQRAEMDSPGSNKSVRFQSNTNLQRKLSDASSQVSSISGRHTSERRSMGAHSHHYNARLQAEMEALNRLEPLDRTSSLQSLPIHRQDSTGSNDRYSLSGGAGLANGGGPGGSMGKKREYSSVQDVRSSESRSQPRPAPDRSHYERSSVRSSHGGTSKSGRVSQQSRTSHQSKSSYQSGRTSQQSLVSNQSRSSLPQGPPSRPYSRSSSLESRPIENSRPAPSSTMTETAAIAQTPRDKDFDKYELNVRDRTIYMDLREREPGSRESYTSSKHREQGTRVKSQIELREPDKRERERGRSQVDLREPEKHERVRESGTVRDTGTREKEHRHIAAEDAGVETAREGEPEQAMGGGGSRSGTMTDLRPVGTSSYTKTAAASIAGDSTKTGASGKRSRRREPREPERSDSMSVKNLGAIYSMPDYNDTLAKTRPRRTMEPPTAPSAQGNHTGPAAQVKWRDSSRHSSLRGVGGHSVKETATPRHKDIYNEYITQKQSLGGYHHHNHPQAAAVPQTVLQSQK